MKEDDEDIEKFFKDLMNRLGLNKKAKARIDRPKVGSDPVEYIKSILKENNIEFDQKNMSIETFGSEENPDKILITYCDAEKGVFISGQGTNVDRLTEVQGSDIKKAPAKRSKKVVDKKSLEKELKEAIKTEDYLKAAELRDKLAKIK